jgi:triosephosphate isomerase
MNKTVDEARALGEVVISGAASVEEVDVAVCPPFLALPALSGIVSGTNVRLGAQDIYPASSGAFTGEISPLMLRDFVDLVIVGHSERRVLLGESNEFVGKKVRIALDHGLTPLLCIGEQLKHRNSGETDVFVEKQVRAGLRDVVSDEMSNVIIAYEPVWAIGTGVHATPEQAGDTIGAIRCSLTDLYDEDVSDSVRILYGGSVNTNNWKELASIGDIDGALVGGASLSSDDFLRLVDISASL